MVSAILLEFKCSGISGFKRENEQKKKSWRGLFAYGFKKKRQKSIKELKNGVNKLVVAYFLHLNCEETRVEGSTP